VAGDQVIRIVIIEDNKVFREALELLLGLRSDLIVVASVSDGEEVVPTVDTTRMCVDGLRLRA
jgi:DNA-binding NarL/FixJ family response regulator